VRALRSAPAARGDGSISLGSKWLEAVGSLLRHRAVRLPVGLLALAGFSLALAVHAASVLGIDSEARWPWVWLLREGTYPVVLMTTLTVWAVAGTRRLRWRDFLSLIPAPALLLIALSLAYVAANFVLFLLRDSGWGLPFVRDGRFFFIDHGVVREVSEDRFHLDRSIVLRWHSGAWAYLYLVAALVLLGARRKAAKSS